MGSVEVTEGMKAARLRYESARLRRAAMGFSPLLLLVPIAVVAGGHTGAGFIVGAGLFMLGTGLLWYGQQANRAVLPGVLAGIVPMLFALCAKNMGACCVGQSCISMCIAACVAGGVVAGGMISAVTYRQRRGVGFWVAAAGMSLLTGALGCSCAGMLGLVGLSAGLGAAALPGLVRAARNGVAAS